MASSLLDVCRFTPTAGGTTDWTFSAAVTGYQSPSAAGVVNASTYSYRAESTDLTQWEIGTGAYTTATGVLARTVVLFNSAGTTAKINFSAAPQVAIVALAEDFMALTNVAPITNSLGADVLLNNTANYFDGPSVAQGTSGTWWASGTVTCLDTAGVAGFRCKLWDGTTVISSSVGLSSGANNALSVSLSGYLASPAGNIRISVKDVTSTSGKIVFNSTGESKDSTVSAFRIK